MVPRGFLRIVGNLGIDVPDGESGRLQLGRWIASPENPLTARVWANRTWHWLFGSGICRTVDNFGMRGELPSHPALLDYLARDLSEHRWSTKYLVRELVMTDAYRRSTESSAGGRQLDPENRLWWRARQKRLDAESLADAMMMASGELDLAVGGPGIESNLANDYGYRRDSRRRAVYWPVLRNSLPRLFEAFDFADPSLVVGRRNVSSVPTQALFMLNDPFVLARAERTADWILQRDGLTDFQRFQLAYRCLLGREPSDRQWRIAREFLEDRQTDRKTAWTKLVQSLFASVDFRYVQ